MEITNNFKGSRSFDQLVVDYYHAARGAGKVTMHERLTYARDQIVAQKQNVFPVTGELKGKRLWLAVCDAIQHKQA